MSSAGEMADTAPQEANNEAIPRLMIKKIVMENFKSYGGIKEIGPFHKCFSSVIGPNGSGKSNVIDAMLFVFGRRANAIRLKKLSELIHNSAALPKCEKCSVAVHFCEIIDHPNSDDGYDVVPNSDFIVTRSVDRSSSSKYYYNDRPVSMNEVVTLLKRKGIDLDHNRFLILQGEVEQIAMMKPKQQQPGGEDGLLEYLEDIIGSNRHIPAITSAEQEVDALNEQRDEKMNRVKIIEKEKIALEQSKEDAISFLKCELSLHHKACHVFQVRAAHHRDELSSLTTQRDTVRERLAAEEEAVRDVVETYARVKGEYDTVNQEAKRVGELLQHCKEQFNELDRRDTGIREGLKHNAENMDAARAHQTQVETELKKLVKGHARDEETLPLLKRELEELEEARVAQDAEIEQIFEEVKQSTEQLRQEMEQTTKQLLPLKQKVNQWTKRKLALAGEVRVLKESLGSAHADLETLASDKVKLEKDLQTRRKAHEEIMAALQAMYARRTDLQQQLQRVSASLATATAEYNKLSGEVAVTREKQASSASRSVIGRELERMKQQDPQTFGGVYGALGDLGYINEKYDLAVSMATPQLRNIVVDTTRTAQACIDLCRRKNLGRATFICLDKLGRQEHALHQPFTAPPNSARLFDLVTPHDPRFRVAFYSVMRNTLVADNLTIANAIAYGHVRHRVVTLQGEVIDISGTMSGGGSGLVRGLMSFRPDSRAAESTGRGEHDLRALEQQLQEKGTQRQEMEDTRMRLANELKDVATQLRQAEADKQRCEGEMGILEERVSSLTRYIAERETARDDSEKTRVRISLLEEELQQVQLGEDDANSACVDLEREQAAIKKRMLDKGGARLQKSKSKVEEIKKKIDAKKKEMMKLDIAIRNFDEKHARLRSDLEACAAELATCEEKRRQMEAEREEVEALALECMREHDRLDGELRELEASVSAKKVLLDQTLTEKQRAEQKKRELEEQLMSLEEHVQREEEVVANVERKLESKKKGCEKTCEDLLNAMKEVDMEEVFWEVREAERKDNIDRKVKVALAAVDAKVKAEMIDEQLASDMRAEAERTAVEEATALTMASMRELNEEEKESYRQEVLQREVQFHREFGLKLLSDEEVRRARLAELEDEVRLLEARLQGMQVNLTAIAEYRRKHQEFSVRQIQLESIVKQRDEAKAQFDALRKTRLEEFMAGFSLISLKLKEMYQMLTLGGDAELELQDSADPFAEGIVFSVRPPKKSWKHIQNLSGGEKTLSSLALVFALHHYKPTPLYVMDEIDAALDFKNVSIVANYIKERTKNAQFIIISLRNNMFELADRLVGIYKTNNITKSVTIDPRCFEVEG